MLLWLICYIGTLVNMLLWYFSTLELYNFGNLVIWLFGYLVIWYFGTLVPKYQWYIGTKVPMVHWYFGASELLIYSFMHVRIYQYLVLVRCVSTIISVTHSLKHSHLASNESISQDIKHGNDSKCI